MLGSQGRKQSVMILSKIGELRGETSARRNTALSSSKVLSTL